MMTDVAVAVLFTSDLHVDVGDFGKIVENRLPALAAEMNPDVFIVAGDVSSHLDKLKRVLRRLSQEISCPKLFVPGNHDIWVARSSQIDSWTKHDELIPAACDVTGFHYLPGNPIEISGVGFAGTIGWYDYSLRNREMDDSTGIEDYRRKRFSGRVWNDKFYARWNRPDEEVAAEFARRLDEDLGRFDSSGAPTICATHHLAFAGMVDHSGDANWDYFSAFMGSASLGETILRHRSVRYVVSGHTHRTKEYVTGRLTALTSPVGYGHELTVEPAEHLKRSLRMVEIESLDC